MCRLFAGLSGVMIAFFGAYMTASLGSVAIACQIIMLTGLGGAALSLSPEKRK